MYFKAADRTYTCRDEVTIPESITLTREEGDDSLTIRRKWCSSRGDLLGRLFWPTCIAIGCSTGFSQMDILEDRFKCCCRYPSSAQFGPGWY